MSNTIERKLIENAVSFLTEKMPSLTSTEEKIFIAATKAKEVEKELSEESRIGLFSKFGSISTNDDGGFTFSFNKEELFLDDAQFSVLVLLIFGGESPMIEVSLDELGFTPWEGYEFYADEWFAGELRDSLCSDETRFYLMKLTVRNEMIEETAFGIVGIDPISNQEFNDPDKALAAYTQAYYGGDYNSDEEGFDHMGILCFPLDAQEITLDKARFMQQKLSTKFYKSIEELTFNKSEVLRYLER